MLKELSLEGKVALVTGAGRGIGKAIALTIDEAGADIVAVARTHQQIEQTAEDVRQGGKKCLPIPTDVTKAEQVQQMVEKTNCLGVWKDRYPGQQCRTLHYEASNTYARF